MNTNSNTYTIVYAAVLVVIVAFLLAFVSRSLRATQDSNVALDKKKQILASLNIRNLSDEDAAAMYKQVVTADAIIDADGRTTESGSQGGETAGFTLSSADMKAGRLALYECCVDGETKYVIPVYGMGLWGAISGYIAIDADRNTVYGAYFTHESETAGLGAEIKDNETWQSQFQGKKLTADGTPGIALSVVKKSNVKDPTTECDAVTGATLTCDGVSLMLHNCLGLYTAFLGARQEPALTQQVASGESAADTKKEEPTYE